MPRSTLRSQARARRLDEVGWQYSLFIDLVGFQLKRIYMDGRQIDEAGVVKRQQVHSLAPTIL